MISPVVPLIAKCDENCRLLSAIRQTDETSKYRGNNKFQMAGQHDLTINKIMEVHRTQNSSITTGSILFSGSAYRRYAAGVYDMHHKENKFFVKTVDN